VLDYDRGLAVNTFDAHRLLWLAEREHGPAVQRDLAARLFRAHFTDGRDVGDREVLAEIAADAGMDAGRVADFLASAEGTREVRDEIAEARQLGIGAVPTFVFEGKYAVEGAQPTSTFLQALEAVERELGQSPETAGDAACADGSCTTES
jgi:predicted DsbA family dithiol-disulfide isomerase